MEKATIEMGDHAATDLECRRKNGARVKVVLLAGGAGTRLSEETESKPKPMVEIGGRPILWHIMKIYAARGHREFFVALGYKSETIKRYFLELHHLRNHLTVELATGRVHVEPASEGSVEDWIVHMIETGIETATGGRVKRLARYVGGETFLMTYGDGVADIDVARLIEFHRSHGKLVTVTAVRPPSRFGGLQVDKGRVAQFVEKPQIGEGWINGGFFVLEPGALDYIRGDETPFEREPLERLAADGELMAFVHEGFWHPMDTQRDMRALNAMWAGGSAPWKVWT